MGCWTVTDDYLLSASVLHLCDLERVYKRVTFSMPFSLVDIHNRWQCLLYDALISKESSSCWSHKQKFMSFNGEDEQLLESGT